MFFVFIQFYNMDIAKQGPAHKDCQYDWQSTDYAVNLSAFMSFLYFTDVIFVRGQVKHLFDFPYLWAIKQCSQLECYMRKCV